MLNQPLNTFPISFYNRGNNIAKNDQDPNQELNKDFLNNNNDDKDFPYLILIKEEDE